MRRHGRSVWRGRSLVVMSSVLVTVTIGCTVSWEKIPAAPEVVADHMTVATPAPRLPNTGPTPGGLGVMWVVDTPERPVNGSESTEAISHRLVDDQLIVASREGIKAFDAMTGKPRWHYREIGRSLKKSAVTGGTVLAMTGRADRTSASVDRWVALDAKTGRFRWASGDRGGTFWADTVAHAVGAGGIVPVTTEPRGKGLQGIDVRTGRARWDGYSLTGPGCHAETAFGSMDPDDSLLLMATECRNGIRKISALDPATGRERWKRELPKSVEFGGVDAIVRDGRTLIRLGTDWYLIGLDGREIAKEDAAHLCDGRCALSIVKDLVVIAPTKRSGEKAGLLTVDLRTGVKHELAGLGGYDALTTVGDRVYGVRSTLAEPLLPAALDVIDPVSRKTRTMPMPYQAGLGMFGNTVVRSLRIAGGRAFVTESYNIPSDNSSLKELENGWVTAMSAPLPGTGGPGTGGPAELGGVPVRDWPDACTMAPGYQKAGDKRFNLPGSTKDTRIGAVRLRHVTCAVQPVVEPTGRRGARTTEVTVAWVTRTPKRPGISSPAATPPTSARYGRTG